MQKTQKNAKTQKNVNFRGKKAKNLEKKFQIFFRKLKKTKMQKNTKRKTIMWFYRLDPPYEFLN